MKKITTILMSVAMFTAMSCSEGNDLPLNVENDNAVQAKNAAYDYTIQVVSPTKQLTIAGQFDTSAYMDFTETMGDSISHFQWKYSDENGSMLVQDGSNSARYIYGNFDSSFYSVRFTNITFSHSHLEFDLVIAGVPVAHVTASTSNASDMPTNMEELFAADNNPNNRLIKKLRTLIPPIDISLGSDNTITINNGNGNGNTTYNGPGQPCTVSETVAALCINAGTQSAMLCVMAGGKPFTQHTPCHQECRFDCK